MSWCHSDFWLRAEDLWYVAPRWVRTSVVFLAGWAVAACVYHHEVCPLTRWFS